MAKKPTLADELEAMPPPRRRNWFDALPPESKESLLEVRRRFVAGKLSHLSMSAIWRHCRKKMDGVPKRDGFREWMTAAVPKESHE